MILLESHITGQRRSWCITEKASNGLELMEALVQREGEVPDVVLQCNGHVLCPTTAVSSGATVVATLRLRGGKGGFGSMLRAIGAQIEKTTNREACRDLSGRRLRDINEEKRLKDFIAKKAEREQEIQERKRQKFKTLKEPPKHIFQDDTYFQQRELREKNLYDSLDKAFGAKNGGGPSGTKRRMKDEGTTTKKKAKFLDDLDESSEDEREDEAVAVVPGGSSGNSDEDSGETETHSEDSSAPVVSDGSDTSIIEKSDKKEKKGLKST